MKTMRLAGLVALGIGLNPSAMAQVQDVSRPESNAVTVVETNLPARENETTTTRQRRPAGGDVIAIGYDAVVAEGEEVSDVVAIFGDAIVDGTARDVVVVWGKARINGVVLGDLVAPLGSVELGSNAHLRRDVIVIGGDLTRAPGARMDRRPFELSWSRIEQRIPALAGVKAWVMQGLILGRPLPHQYGWWWSAALGFALVAILIGAICNRPVAASAAVLETQPVRSFLIGVMMFILIGPLLLLLSATVVGLIIVPLVCLAAFVAFLVGKVAVYRLVGEQIGKQLGASFLQSPLVALVAGLVLFYALYTVPVLGFLVWGTVAPFAFGAASLAVIRALRVEATGRALNGVPVPPDVSPSSSGEMALASGTDALSLPRAGFWVRLAATFLDFLLVAAISALTGFPPFFLIAWVAYHVGMWSWKGTTIGGIVFGVKIVRQDGRDLNFAVALVRSLSSFFSALVLFFGFFWAGWNREKLSWHDMIAGTVVVRMPKGASLV